MREAVDINADTLTKHIEARPVVKVIGNTEYIVEIFFNEEADCNLSGKIKRLMDNDIKSLNRTLLPAESELTSHNPDRP
ncbi:MAG: transposon-encoded TnpW family protein [Christensenellales bacterium]